MLHSSVVYGAALCCGLGELRQLNANSTSSRDFLCIAGPVTVDSFFVYEKMMQICIYRVQ